MVLCGIGLTVQNSPGNRVRCGNPDRILERVEVDVEMGGKSTPGDADAFAVQVHFNAEALAEKVRHQLDHRVCGESLALLDALVCLQLEACQGGHDEEITVEISHCFLEQSQLKRFARVCLEQVRPRHCLAEIGCG